MNLIERIRNDRLEARKIKDNVKSGLLGVLIGDACKDVKEPDDVTVEAMIKSFLKKNAEAQDKISNGGFDIPVQFITEKTILDSYLPKQLDEQEIRDIVATRKDNGDNNLGVIMKFFKEHYSGKYDGALASKIIKEFI